MEQDGAKQDRVEHEVAENNGNGTEHNKEEPNKLCQNIGGNKFSASGVSPKWVKSKRRRRRKRERKTESW